MLGIRHQSSPVHGLENGRTPQPRLWWRLLAFSIGPETPSLARWVRAACPCGGVRVVGGNPVVPRRRQNVTPGDIRVRGRTNSGVNASRAGRRRGPQPPPRGCERSCVARWRTAVWPSGTVRQLGRGRGHDVGSSRPPLTRTFGGSSWTTSPRLEVALVGRSPPFPSDCLGMSGHRGRASWTHQAKKGQEAYRACRHGHDNRPQRSRLS